MNIIMPAVTAIAAPTPTGVRYGTRIKYVVENGIELAKKYGADIEIVELGALLHDIAMPSEYGEREQHHIYGAEIAEQLLTELNYPKGKNPP